MRGEILTWAAFLLVMALAVPEHKSPISRGRDDKDGLPKAAKTAFRVVGDAKEYPGEVWLEPVTPPVISFRVLKGAPAKGIMMCEQTTEERKVTDERHFTVLVLSCEDGSKLEMSGLDFGGAK